MPVALQELGNKFTNYFTFKLYVSATAKNISSVS